MKTPILIAFFFAASFPVFAQSYKAFQWEGGAFLGGANYAGDINPGNSPRFGDTRPAIGIIGRVPIGSKLGIRSNLAYGGLTGDDLNYPIRESRGYRFTAQILELSLSLEFEPLGRDRFYANAKGDVMMDRLFSPYLLAGIGFAFANINPDFSRNSSPALQEKIADDLRRGSSFTTPVVPLGGGLKFDLTQKYSVALETAIRIPFSDYIDGISLAAGPTADDVYVFSGFILYYRF